MIPASDPVSEVMLPPLPIAAGMVKIAGSMTEVFTADQMQALQLQVKQADARGDEAMRRAHAAEATIGELEKDAARMEWCESRCYFPEYCSHGSVGWYIDGTGIQQMPTARAAIDAALAAQQPEASNGR